MNEKGKEIDISSIIIQIGLGIEIAKIALECPTCHKAVKELLENSPVKGRPSLAAIGENVGETNVILSKNSR